ncbi:MAG: ATP-binding protein [Planctomycetes bacterium]|nr:ATP-binding protein [Planctomycetota bacterium]
MSRITIPSPFGPLNALRWFADWSQFSDDRDLELELPAGLFVAPAGVALLAAGIADRSNKGVTTKFHIVDEGSDAVRYLQRIDFFQRLGVSVDSKFKRHDPTGRFVTLGNIGDLRAARDLADAARTFVEMQLPGAPPSVIRSIHFVVEELAANIVQHSGRPETGFGLAQGFPASNRFQLAFADAGIGFLESLQKNPEISGRIDADADAIQLATEQGLSSTPGRGNMGLGLSVLRDLSDRLSADLWIASGNALWSRKTVAGKRVSIVQSVERWQGAWICLDSPVLPARG